MRYPGARRRACSRLSRFRPGTSWQEPRAGFRYLTPGGKHRSGPADVEATGRACCFGLEGEVHTLVAATLLRLGRRYTLGFDSQAEPPARELGEIEQSIRTGEGDAVIGSDSGWQAALGKQLLEGGKCEVFAGGLEGLTQQQEARSVIPEGERIAIMPVAELELALEVGAPQVIRSRAL